MTINASKCAKIRNRYKQEPHLSQDTNGKVANPQFTPRLLLRLESVLFYKTPLGCYENLIGSDLFIYSSHRSELFTTNENQEVSPFPAGDHKAQINRRAQRHNKHKKEKHKYPQKSTALEWSVKYFTGGL